jgi:hypothetical protein
MIAHPFAYDGLVIYGDLARRYVEGQNFSLTMEQSPLLYNFSLLWAKFFGLSYSGALLSQSLLFLLLHCGLSYCTCYFARKQGEKIPYGRFLGFSLAILLIFGVFKVLPGGLIDFRRDLISSLLLAHAFFALPLANAYSAFVMLLCLSERFHCLPVLGAAAFGGAILLRQKRFAYVFLASFAVYLILRWQAFINMAYYYRFHVGISDGVDVGISSYLSKSFYTFYAYVFGAHYLSFVNVLFPIACLLLVGRKFFTFKSRTVRFLLIASFISLALLYINKTRNNEGVLRYFVVPFCLAFAAQLSLCFSSLVKRRQKILLWTIALFTIANLAYNGRYLWNYDYKDLQAQNYKARYFRFFEEVYASTAPDKTILAASDFVSDLNFTPHQWFIFLGERGLAKRNYELLLGTEYLLRPELFEDYAKRLESIDIYYHGSPGCNDGLPAAADLPKLFAAKRKILNQRCSKLAATFALAGCEIRAYRCH